MKTFIKCAIFVILGSACWADSVQPIVPVAGVVYGSRYKTLTSTPAVTIDTTTALLTATKGVKTSTLTFLDGTKITSTSTFAGGTISNVIAGAGLAGGGASGAVTVSVSSVSLSSQVVGNLSVTNLAGGSGASNSTFWRGDGTWVAVSPVLLSSGVAFGSATNGVTQDLTQFTWNGPLASGLFASTATVSSMTVVNGSIGTGTLGTATIGLGGSTQAALFKGQSISFQNNSNPFANHFDFNFSETAGGTSGVLKYHGTGAIGGSPTTPPGFIIGRVGMDIRSGFDGPALFIYSTASLNFGNGLSGTRMVGLRAPDSVSNEVIWKLPSSDLAGAWYSDGATNLSITPVGVLAGTQTWTGGNNWTTLLISTFAGQVVVGSMTVNDLSISSFVVANANKKLSSFDLFGSLNNWTGQQNFPSPAGTFLTYGVSAGSVTVTGISTGTVLFTNTSGRISTGTVILTSQVQGILPIANGGSGSASPAIVAGANVTVSGSWPNQTINAISGGASALGVFNNTTSISSPTVSIVADSTTITAYLIGTSSSGLKVNTSSVTAQGNLFNSANQLVKLSAGNQFPASDGNLITNVNAAAVTGTLNISSGTISSFNAATINASGLVTVSSFTASSGTITGPFNTVGNTTIGGIGAQVFIPNLGNGGVAGAQRFVTISTVIGGNPLSAQGIVALDIPAGSNNYIQNTSSLQSGATFYVSSGTVTSLIGNKVFISSALASTFFTSGPLTIANPNIGAGQFYAPIIFQSGTSNVFSMGYESGFGGVGAGFFWADTLGGGIYARLDAALSANQFVKTGPNQDLVSYNLFAGTQTWTGGNTISSATFTTSFAFPSKTLAVLNVTTPTINGQAYNCTTCVSHTVCVATQTVTASWASTSSRATNCQ